MTILFLTLQKVLKKTLEHLDIIYNDTISIFSKNDIKPIWLDFDQYLKDPVNLTVEIAEKLM